jgi:hypothetical protein
MDQGNQTGGADSGTAEDLKQTIKSTADAVKEQTRQMADDVKDQGAEKIGGVTRAVRGAADELGREVPQLATYLHGAADRVDGAAQALRERSVEEMATSFFEFARRQPTAAFAVSAVAGFALTRFLKSSASPN